MSTPQFNLLEEQWLPCVDRVGQPQLLGVRETLLRARELADLGQVSPITRAALLRLLLAVLHAALSGPRSDTERAEIWESGWDVERLETYFRKWKDRFDLCDPKYPFYQDPQQTVEKPKSITCLAAELASGNNATLFDHTLDYAPPVVGPAEAARWLVTTQYFSLGGLDKSKSINYGPSPSFYQSPAVKGALVMLQGASLFETLLLNLLTYSTRRPVPQTGTEPDLPIWERDGPPPPGRRTPLGYLDYLTWPNRCVRIEFVGNEGGPRAGAVHLSQGSIFPEIAGFHDPFFALRNTDQGPRALRLSAGRALWRDSGALFGFASDPNAPKQGGAAERPPVVTEAVPLARKLGQTARWELTVSGLDFDQAKINLWRAEELPSLAPLLNDRAALRYVTIAVKVGEEAGQSLRSALRLLAVTLLQPPDPSRPDARPNPKEVDRMLRSWNAEAQYWPALEAPFRAFLRQVGRDETREAALAGWKRQVRAAALDAFHYAGAFAGRDTRALRARVEAERVLFGHLHKLLPQGVNL